METVLTDLVYDLLINKLIQNSFELCNQSDIFLNKFFAEVRKHPNLTEWVLEIISSTDTKHLLGKHWYIVEPRTQMDLSSTASEYFSRTRHKQMCSQFGITHKLKVEKKMKRAPLASPTQSETT